MRNKRTALLVCAALAASLPALAQNSFSEDVRRNPAGRGSQDSTTNRRENQPPPPPVDSRVNPVPAPSPGPAPKADPRFAKVEEAETKDFGVEPTERLHEAPMHAPTPTRIPGALVITTGALNALYENNPQGFVVFDVLGGQQILPNAQNALPAGQGGSFSDDNQKAFGNYLQQVTGGDKDVALVFYCQGVECWMSYNACLRAVKLGYTNVLWYRGGVEAWQAAGLKLQQRQMQ